MKRGLHLEDDNDRMADHLGTRENLHEDADENETARDTDAGIRH